MPGVSKLSGWSSAFQGKEDRGVAKHPTKPWTALRITIQPKMSVVPRLRNSALREVSCRNKSDHFETATLENPLGDTSVVFQELSVESQDQLPAVWVNCLWYLVQFSLQITVASVKWEMLSQVLQEFLTYKIMSIIKDSFNPLKIGVIC